MSNNKQQTAVEQFIQKLEEKAIEETEGVNQIHIVIDVNEYLELKEQAKEMEKDKHKRFNEFLDDEKILGISDLKTIERIKWYYNTYFNETYGGNK